MDWKKHLFLGSVVLALSACTDSARLTTSPDGSGDVSGTFELSAPESILSARAVNLDALFADVVIRDDQGSRTERFEQGTPITTTFSVAQGSRLEVTVMWYEAMGGSTGDLLLSTWSMSRDITDNTTINVPSSDYTSEGEGFDKDGDNFSNLTELRANSDPDNASITPETALDVEIRWVNPAEAPVIDGLYDSIWNNASFNDVAGEQLSIDNLMINQGALRPDGNTEFRWFAMHDDTFLYVFVLGENVDTATPIRDSTSVWNDDNINLFIDGNNSKGSSYDGVDDRHIFVPLLNSPENPTGNSTVFVAGDFSAPMPDFDFATCLCSAGQHTWEFKLPLAGFGITKNEPFGFEVQLDEDNDGGARDARWGWRHPSRTSSDVDNTWTTPSFMGTAIIK